MRSTAGVPGAALVTLSGLTGKRVEPEYGPVRPGDIRHSAAGIDLAREYLRYEPTVGLLEGLRETWQDLVGA